jgi:hypothetical protein
VKKRQRRPTGVDEIVLSLYAKGLTTGNLRALRADLRREGVDGDHLPGPAEVPSVEERCQGEERTTDFRQVAGEQSRCNEGTSEIRA